MNIEDAFFEYPYAEFRSDLEEEFTDIVKRKRKVYMTSIGLIGLGIAFLLTFLLTRAACAGTCVDDKWFYDSKKHEQE
ncbi:hypothetical protein [Ruminococcus sp.]|uniref:hypothetical protein n=1 Tax=Ruminococcus sp. TaxID=41978 RepID=UPI0025F05DEA|nr:hypothetical protein [Ruminococcus sp.]MBQ8965507.1 hypothetical protein [Ruminococcus sp.]